MIFNSLLKLLGSSTLAQVILILISPILTRIYKPEVFGVFVTLISIVYIINSISQARMNVAIFSAKDEQEVSVIFSLGIFFIIITVIISTIIIFILDFIYTIEDHFYLIPVMVFSLSTYQLIISFFLKNDDINYVTKNRLIQGFILGLSQILFGLLNPSVYALAVAQVFSFFFTNILSLTELKNTVKLFDPRQYFSKYKNFILYDTGGNFFQILSSNLAPILITYLLGNYIGGVYYMAYRVLIMPVSIFSVSITQIISSRFNINGDNVKWINQNNTALQILIFIFCIPFAILASYIDYFIPIIFGSEWSDTGIVIRYFAAWIFLRLIYDSFSIHFSLNRKSKEKIILDTILFIYMVATFYSLEFFGLQGLDYLIKLAFLNTLAYVFAIIFLSYKNGFESFRNLIYIIFSTVVIYTYPNFHTIYLTLLLVIIYMFVLTITYKRILRLTW